MKCPTIHSIENGGYSPSNATFTYGTGLSFGCDFNYILNGTTTLVCQADGTWNGEVPSCRFNGQSK